MTLALPAALPLAEAAAGNRAGDEERTAVGHSKSEEAVLRRSSSLHQETPPTLKRGDPVLRSPPEKDKEVTVS